jgi:hypothetical protein
LTRLPAPGAERRPNIVFVPIDDLGEQIDLAARHPEVVARIREALLRWLDDTKALIPEPNRQPEPFAELKP